MSTSVQDGNVRGQYVVGVSWTPTAVATITAPEQTVAVPGVQLTDVVIDVTAPGVTAGVTIGATRVTAAGTVGVQFVNPTAGSLTPPAGLWKFTVIRIDGPSPQGIAQ